MAGTTDIALAYSIDPALAQKIEQVARHVGIPDPGWLANVINFESNGFNPQAVNPFSGATGLIQFMPTTASELGTNTAQLRTMSALQQMDYVAAYFMLPRVRQYGALRSQLDVYMAVFYPKAIGQGPGYVFPALVHAANPGMFTAGAYAAVANARAKLSTVTPTALAHLAPFPRLLPVYLGIGGGVVALLLIVLLARRGRGRGRGRRR